MWSANKQLCNKNSSKGTADFLLLYYQKFILRSLKSFQKNISVNVKPLEIKYINLDDIKIIYDSLDSQKSQVESITDEIPIHFHKTSFYTVLLYVLLIIILIYML